MTKSFIDLDKIINTELDNLLDQAVMLVWAAEGIIGNRRALEHTCGYPDEYGGDELLHQRLKDFLKLRLVDIRVKKINTMKT